jgi:hypothetical protein
MVTSRWGKLKTAVIFCLIDHSEAKTREIARYRWDRAPTRSQCINLARAARSIARRVRRSGKEWIWRLDPDKLAKH